MRLITSLFLFGLLGCQLSTPAEQAAASSNAVMGCADEMTYCVLDDLPPGGDEELRAGGCFITGGGHFGSAAGATGAGRHGEDSFGFNAMGMKDGTVRGELQDTSHLGDVFHGTASWLRCYRDDGEGPEVPKAVPNVAEWGGSGAWNHVAGHTWEARMADRAEGGSGQDEYELWVWDGAGELVYEQTRATRDRIAGGNLQIHPPNGGHPYFSDAP